MTNAASRTEKVVLRVSRAAKQLLQSAASASRRWLCGFVLASALARVAETSPDRQRFGLDAESWAAFQADMDAPPRPLPRLARLLSEPSVFERPALR